MGSRSVLRTIQAPLKLGAWEGPWSASTQEESKDQKQFGEIEPPGMEAFGS